MAKYKIEKTNLLKDGETYPEGTVADFDSKKKDVKELIKKGILVKADPNEVESEEDNKSPNEKDKV